MKSLENRKKALIMLYTYIILLFAAKNTFKKKETVITYNDNYIYDNTLPYAYYKDFNIYIGSDEEISLIKEDDNNIYIIDNRDDNNPTMSIYNSYKINNINKIKSILNILIKYENDYSSEWNRTVPSMEREWIIHNICYLLNYESFRTEKVDLDNEDEFNYDSICHVISKAREIISIEEENKKEMMRSLNKFQ